MTPFSEWVAAASLKDAHLRAGVNKCVEGDDVAPECDERSSCGFFMVVVVGALQRVLLSVCSLVLSPPSSASLRVMSVPSFRVATAFPRQ